jgi:hypothetical protein
LSGSSGIFTTQVSGVLITGNTIQATSGIFQFLQAVNQTFSGNLTFSGNTFTLGSGYFSSGISVTGTISGQTVTGTTAQFTTITGGTAGFTTVTGITVTGTNGLFTNITGTTLQITTPSGATPAIICSGVVSGSTAGFVIQGPLIILP